MKSAAISAAFSLVTALKKILFTSLKEVLQSPAIGCRASILE
jgi:hypothetical protein